MLAVNGSEDVDVMSKSLADLVRRKISLRLEHGEAKKAATAQADSSAEQAQDPDATFNIELQAVSGTAGSWGFQLETGTETAGVKSITDGSPLAMWNIACRSRGKVLANLIHSRFVPKSPCWQVKSTCA